jgi:excisionase family DNA binding protein
VQTLLHFCRVFRSGLLSGVLMTKLSEFLKTAEAAELLGVSQNTLRKWAEAGKIPMRRNPANGYRLFKRSDLMRFLAKLEPPQS